MKMNRRYKTRNWSTQARELSDKQYLYYKSEEYPDYGEAQIIEFFQNSYRHPMIVNRAAKRFGRKVRQGR